MKMIYALIKKKMLRWGFFEEKTEVVLFQEQYTWLNVRNLKELLAWLTAVSVFEV